jgi:hypothetical protein
MSAVLGMLKAVPAWCWGLILVAGLCVGFELHGRSVVKADWAAADEARNEIVRETRRAQRDVVAHTEVIETVRLQTIYLKGTEIEKLVPVYINAEDNQHFGVNVGFVRVYNAAWHGETPGSAAESDRGSAGIPLSDVAGVDAHNATSCLAWREIAIGLRRHYAELQATVPEQ